MYLYMPAFHSLTPSSVCMSGCFYLLLFFFCSLALSLFLYSPFSTWHITNRHEYVRKHFHSMYKIPSLPLLSLMSFTHDFPSVFYLTVYIYSSIMFSRAVVTVPYNFIQISNQMKISLYLNAAGVCRVYFSFWFLFQSHGGFDLFFGIQCTN